MIKIDGVEIQVTPATMAELACGDFPILPGTLAKGATVNCTDCGAETTTLDVLHIEILPIPEGGC